MKKTKPKIEIDLEQVETLAGQGLTNVEICRALGIGETTLYTRKRQSTEIEEAIKRGKAKAHAVVANALFRLAQSGNIAAIIWYEKTRCGITERKPAIVQEQTIGEYTYEAAIEVLAPPKNEK